MGRGLDQDGTPTKRLNEALAHNVRFAQAPPALSPYLAGYHGYEIRCAAGDRFEEVFFPALANIRFLIAGERWAMRYGATRIDPIPTPALFGPTGIAGIAEFGAGTMFGVGITPPGWARLIGGDAGVFTDAIVPLETVLGGAAGTLAARIGEAGSDFDACVAAMQEFLLARLQSSKPEPPEIGAIMALLADPGIESVEQAATRLDMPVWRLTRLCRRNFGFAPKRLMRRARFLRTLMRLREPSPLPWTDRLDAGYHDQSHFIRDCRDFLGMTPGQFLARAQPIANTSMAERTRILGAPAQALHRAKDA